MHLSERQAFRYMEQSGGIMSWMVIDGEFLRFDEKGRVLTVIIEDYMVRDACRRYLQRHGMTYTSVEEAQEAFRRGELKRPRALF